MKLLFLLLFFVSSLSSSAAYDNFVSTCKWGKVIHLQRILQDNPDLDINVAPPDCDTSWSPLYGACEAGNLEVAEFLLEHQKVDINGGGRNGETPLCVACTEGHLKIVKLLLEKVANVNKFEGMSPFLLYAFLHEKLNMVPLLMRYGARIDENLLSEFVSQCSPARMQAAGRALQLAQNSQTSLSKMGFEFLA